MFGVKNSTVKMGGKKKERERRCKRETGEGGLKNDALELGHVRSSRVTSKSKFLEITSESSGW